MVVKRVLVEVQNPSAPDMRVLDTLGPAGFGCFVTGICQLMVTRSASGSETVKTTRGEGVGAVFLTLGRKRAG